MDLVSQLREMRSRALTDARAFLALYEEALTDERYLAADAYREQRSFAEGRAHALDSILALVAP